MMNHPNNLSVPELRTVPEQGFRGT